MNKKKYFFECVDGMGLDPIQSSAIKNLFHQCFEANELPDQIVATYGEVPPSDGSPYVDENGHFVDQNAGWQSEDIKEFSPGNMKSKLGQRMFGKMKPKVTGPDAKDTRNLTSIGNAAAEGNYAGAEALAKAGQERNRILKIQHMLNQKYGFGLKEDGVWGPKTANAWRYHTKGPQNVVVADKAPNFEPAHDQSVPAGSRAGAGAVQGARTAQAASNAGLTAKAYANAAAFNRGEMPTAGTRTVKPNVLTDGEIEELQREKAAKAAVKGTYVGRPELYDDDPNQQPGNYGFNKGY